MTKNTAGTDLLGSPSGLLRRFRPPFDLRMPFLSEAELFNSVLSRWRKDGPAIAYGSPPLSNFQQSRLGHRSLPNLLTGLSQPPVNAWSKCSLGVVREVVRAAYLPVFSIVDPARDTDTALHDAFRRYEPSAQRTKMISLFRGLCEASGIIENRGHHRSGGSRPKKETDGADGSAARKHRVVKPRSISTSVPVEPATVHQAPPVEGPDYRLVSAVIQRLPREGKWTSAQRERWLAAMTSAIDLIIEVEEGRRPGGADMK